MLGLSLLSQFEQGGFSLLAISINCLIRVSGWGSIEPSFKMVGCLELEHTVMTMYGIFITFIKYIKVQSASSPIQGVK